MCMIHVGRNDSYMIPLKLVYYDHQKMTHFKIHFDKDSEYEIPIRKNIWASIFYLLCSVKKKYSAYSYDDSI